MIKKLGYATLIALTVGCGSETTPDEETQNKGGKGDFTDKVVCNIVNKSGRELDPTQLRDPIMGFGLRGGNCPTNLQELMDKFQETEGDTNCKGDVETYVISETAQPSGTEEGSNYRLVISKECGDLDRHKMMFSIFGVTPNVASPTDNPDDWNLSSGHAEMLAYDDTNGVYNYYQHSGGDKYEYFGDSDDFVKNEGGRCKNCHMAGTPVMLELDTPWLHWEGHEKVPGAGKIVSAHTDLLGSKASGSTLESIIKDGNEEYQPRRLEKARLSGDIKTLLRPLFCKTEVNVDNFSDFKTSKVSRIPGDFWVDPILRGSSVPMGSDVYEQAILDSEQIVQGVSGENNKDTVFRGAFLERSFSDKEYVNELKRAGVIDENFMKNVLLIDFTQPLFSDIRCGLLEFAPTNIDLLQGLSSNNGATNNGAASNNGTGASNNGGSNNGTTAPATPAATLAEQVTAGFIANLGEVEGNEAAIELKEKLESGNVDRDVLTAFFDACKARPQAELMTDVLRILSFHRNAARSMEVFEFINKLPQDNLNETSPLTLDPTTCDLL